MIKLMYEKLKDEDKKSKILCSTGKLGRVPLHYASSFGRLDIVKKFLEWDVTRETIEKVFKLPWEPQFMDPGEQVYRNNYDWHV